MNTAKVRESNIELLRIVAMFFIMCHHFIHNALFDMSIGTQNGLTLEFGTYSLLEGFFYVGVNCFILISGYYGIKLRARKIWAMYLQLACYGVGCYLFEALVYHKPITHTVLTKSLFIFSHPCWWFVSIYLLLMFLSPWINYGIKQMTKQQYQIALLVLTFVQVYLGWFWQKKCYDPDGYSLLNFIYIYIIGGYIGRFVTKDLFLRYRWNAMGIYALCAIVFGVCNILRLYITIPFGNNYGYNNPIVICGALALFMYMLSFNFSNKYVNWFAGGAFATYLITDTQYFGYHMYMAFDRFFTKMIPLLWEKIIVMMFFAATIVVLCSCIDKLRVWLMKPILPAFDWIDRKYSF